MNFEQQMVIKPGKYSISNRGLAGYVGFALEAIKNKSICAYMACANPHSLVVVSKDAVFESALKDVGILVPDGTYILINIRHQNP
ncbi:MAG: hypothetical protein JJV92_07270 [Desulfosarcina sp.]|nr:hypothetical protein [Desulfobacterales bacterium]